MVSRCLLFLCLVLVPSSVNAESIHRIPENPIAPSPPATTPGCEVCPGCGDCTLCGHKPAICAFYDQTVQETLDELQELARRLGNMCADATINGGFDDPESALQELIDLDDRIIDLVRIYQSDKSRCPCGAADDQGVFNSVVRLIQVRHDCVYDAVSYSPMIEPEDELRPAPTVTLN